MKDGKYLSLILFTIFLILSDINVFAFNTITPNSSGVNIQSNIHGDPVDTNGNYYYYRTYNGGTGYGNFGSVVSGKFNGFIGYVSNVPIIGGNHYRVTFNTSTRDLRPNWTSSDIKVCFNFTNLIDCGTVNNIQLIGPNGAGTYFNSASFDFYMGQLDYGVIINYEWFILINGSLVTNNGVTYPQLGLNNKDLSGDNNWKFDTVNIKIVATDDPPPPVDPDDPDDPDDGTITGLLQENNSWLKKIHDFLIDDTIEDFEDIIESMEDNFLNNGIVSGFINIPYLVYDGFSDSLPLERGTCQPLYLGKVLNKSFTIPCYDLEATFIYDESGNVSTFNAYTIVDFMLSCIAIYFISRQFVKLYKDFAFLRGGDEFD